AERVVRLGEDVARRLADTPAFGDLVSRHVETAAERHIAESVARRHQEIEDAIAAKKQELEQIQTNLDQLAPEYDRRAAGHEEELRKRVAERVESLEERERQADQRQKFLDDQQQEFLARFRSASADAAAAVLAQLPLLRALGLGDKAAPVSIAE